MRPSGERLSEPGAARLYRGSARLPARQDKERGDDVHRQDGEGQRRGDRRREHESVNIRGKPHS
jgi:hypothetical protein